MTKLIRVGIADDHEKHRSWQFWLTDKEIIEQARKSSLEAYTRSSDSMKEGEAYKKYV